MKLLVEKCGAQVNQIISSVDDGSTPIFMATLSGKTDVVDYLISAGARVSHIASQFTYFDLIKSVAKGGANLDCIATDFSTPLYLAAQEGHLEIVQFLIESGTLIDRVTDEGMSALSVAAKNGHLSVVQYLVEKCANVNLIDNGEMSVLHRACSLSDDHHTTVQFLINHGANPNTVNNKGQSPLVTALKKSFNKICSILIDAKVPVNACAVNKFYPPLAYSADTEMTKILLQHGARVNEKLPTGAPIWTRLILEDVTLETLRLLNELGVDFMEQFEGESALSSSINSRNYDMALFFARLNMKLWRDKSAKKCVKELLDSSNDSAKELMNILWEQCSLLESAANVPQDVMKISYSLTFGSMQFEEFVGVRRVAGLIRMIRECYNVPAFATLEYTCHNAQKESYCLHENVTFPKQLDCITLSIRVVMVPFTIRQNRFCNVAINTSSR